MTPLSDLVARIRSTVNDRDVVNPTGLRYSDEDIVAALNQGYALTWAYRPDAVLDQLTEVPHFTTSDVAEKDSPLSSFYDEPLVFYAAGFLSLRDDEHVNSNRASQLLVGFQSRLTQL